MSLNLLYAPNVLVALFGAAGVFVVFLSIVLSPVVRGRLRRTIQGGLVRDPEAAAPLTWQDRLQVRLNQADLDVSANEFLRVVLVSTLIAGVAGWLLLGGVAAGLITALLAFIMYWTYLEDRRDKRRQQYQEALPEVVDEICASFDAISGAAMVQVFENVAAHGPTATRLDFGRMARGLRERQDLAIVLDEVENRRQDMILTNILGTLRLQQEFAGSEISGILAHLAAAVRNIVSIRKRIRAEQTKITWEGRIMCLAPFAFLFVIQITAPQYSRPFYNSPLGQLAILAAGVLSLAAYFVSRRIANGIFSTIDSRPYPSLQKLEEEARPEAPAPV
ncbi:MAG: hypothetical protein KKA73_11640 [Chloroflexi bacterium]|nr:hypothetical protein [Chloroflexota bacterium]MBU1748331.1 hypothetical protein [Chloroflexota bacterium]